MDRQQPLKSKQIDRKIVIASLIVVVMILTAVMIFVKGYLTEYTPPAVDKASVSGVPEVDDKYYYDTVQVTNGYAVGIAACLFLNDQGNVDIYLTNPKTSKVDLVCEIYDEEGEKLLAKTGRILPDSYVKTVEMLEEITEDTDVKIKLYGLNHEEYTSEGTAKLSLTIYTKNPAEK